MNPVLVYGNHRSALNLLDDYFEYFQQCFASVGRKLDFAAEPVAGNLNFLIDQFDLAYVNRVHGLKSQSGTRFVLVATEFITGETFNNFGFNRPIAAQIGTDTGKALRLTLRSAVSFVPPSIRDVGYRLFPKLYLTAKAHYTGSASNSSVVDFTDLRRFWKERFDCFKAISDVADEIWCVSPDQMDEYRKLFGDKVKLLPIVSFREELKFTSLDAERDVDFLFTGSLTPYRKEYLDRLASEGFKIVVGTPDWPVAIREHFLNRAKVCLHLRQGPQWQFPSIMRLHHLIDHGCDVLAENSPKSCNQQRFTTQADAAVFLEKAKELIAEGNHLKRGLAAQNAYYNESAMGRKIVSDMLQAL